MLFRSNSQNYIRNQGNIFIVSLSSVVAGTYSFRVEPDMRAPGGPSVGGLVEEAVSRLQDAILQVIDIIFGFLT